jgi:hypothetical protein
VVGLFAALLIVGRSREGAQVTVLRGLGAPYVVVPDGVQTQLRVKLENHESRAQTYRIELSFGEERTAKAAAALGGKVILPENPVTVPSLGRRTVGGFVIMPEAAFQHGKLPVLVRIIDSQGTKQTVKYQLLGPAR